MHQGLIRPHPGIKPSMRESIRTLIKRVEGCHGDSYPVSNQNISEGNTYTSGDLRDGTVVPYDAVGVWLMLYGAADGVTKNLSVDSADITPDNYSSRIVSEVSGQSRCGLAMVRLGTGSNAGKVKIKALSGNWSSVFAWPVGWWK